jgi:hypothetical protein
MVLERFALRRSRRGRRLVCVVLLAEAANAADILQTLLETRKAAIHAVIAFVVLRAPWIVLGLRAAGADRKRGNRDSKNQQMSHGWLRSIGSSDQEDL